MILVLSVKWVIKRYNKLELCRRLRQAGVSPLLYVLDRVDCLHKMGTILKTEIVFNEKEKVAWIPRRQKSQENRFISHCKGDRNIYVVCRLCEKFLMAARKKFEHI